MQPNLLDFILKVCEFTKQVSLTFVLDFLYCSFTPQVMFNFPQNSHANFKFYLFMILLLGLTGWRLGT